MSVEDYLKDPSNFSNRAIINKARELDIEGKSLVDGSHGLLRALYLYKVGLLESWNMTVLESSRLARCDISEDWVVRLVEKRRDVLKELGLCNVDDMSFYELEHATEVASG